MLLLNSVARRNILFQFSLIPAAVCTQTQRGHSQFLKRTCAYQDSASTTVEMTNLVCYGFHFLLIPPKIW